MDPSYQTDLQPATQIHHNALPDYLKSSVLSFGCFRQQLKTFLFCKYWHQSQHYFSSLETLLMRSTNAWYLLTYILTEPNCQLYNNVKVYSWRCGCISIQWRSDNANFIKVRLFTSHAGGVHMPNFSRLVFGVFCGWTIHPTVKLS